MPAQSPFRVKDKLVKVVTDNPTITAGAYSANDAVGGLITFTDAIHPEYAGGVVQTITIIDDALQNAEFELHLFDQTFTATSDNAAFDPTDDDLENYIGYVLVTTADYAAFTDNSAASVSNIGLAFYKEVLRYGKPCGIEVIILSNKP